MRLSKLICFLLLILCLCPEILHARKKVGLVLGGGGAKGVSHIGVLKVLEEAGIPIDYIAGTSMGAIVGGLYAIGYSATEIDSMVASQDWQLLLSDRVKRDNLTFPEKENSERYVISLPFGIEKKDRLVGGMIKGQNLQNLFSNLTIGYHDSVDFNSFPIPFACVAVNLVDGKDFVFRKGSLPIAMRASMAIPAAFTPVKLDSMVLVDGGLNNNYPADVVKMMGADIIIGVDLGTSDLKNLQHLNSTIGVVGQIVALHGYEKYVHNTEITDLLIRPNTSPYNSASFTTAALDTLIMRGEEAARKQWNELLTLKEKIGSDSISTN
ncbi:MAG: patatin-like phospholipase family protein, partial [Parabacteroides sp.]|nr:patatin-like phospholipase family protein [Parabacteroides sp.]